MKCRTRVPQWSALVAMGLFVIVPPVLAQDCPELIGHWPFGLAGGVGVSGNYAFFGSGVALAVADVSTPTSPHMVGHVVLPDSPLRVELSGDYAYVLLRSGMHIIDVSTPSAPAEVGSHAVYLGKAIAVAGDHVYVVTTTGLLHVIDVSTPSSPIPVGSASVGTAVDVAVSGDHAYVAANYSGLVVVDVSTPSDPEVIGSSDVPDAASGVASDGSHVFVLDSHPTAPLNGLYVFDVSTPTDPVDVGFLEITSRPHRVEAAGDFVYAISGFFGPGLHVIDVSDPTNPVEVGYNPDGGTDLAVTGTHVYATYFGGMRIIDVSTPSTPIQVGFFDTPASPDDVAASRGYAYGASYDGVQIFDVRAPSTPTVVEVIDVSARTLALDESGEFLYVLGGSHMFVYDVSTPTAPVWLGTCNSAEPYTADIAASGGYVFVTAGNSLQVIDVSDPSTPTQIGFYSLPGVAGTVEVLGDYAYVVCSTMPGWGIDGLVMLDISTPSAPTEVWVYEAQVRGVAASGSYAYVSEQHGLRVFDVSTPSPPIEVGYCEFTYGGYVTVSGGHAYVGGSGGLRVIDVSTPSSPNEIGFADTPGSGGRVTVSGGYVFMAAGLQVFRSCGAVFIDGFESGDTSRWSAVVPHRLVCQSVNNLTTNCGFDTGISNWTQSSGTFSWERGDGNDAPGCMEAVSQFIPGEYVVQFEQCISPVAPSTSYGFGGSVKLVSGGPPAFCRITARNYDSPDCSGNPTSSQDVQTDSFSGGWDQMNSQLTTDSATRSGLVIVFCYEFDPWIEFTVRFDDIFVGVDLVPVALQSFTVE